MHEMGIAIELYRTCRETIREHGEGRLRHVKIAVGELAAVEPDLLSFGWEAVTVDTPDEGAELEIDFLAVSFVRTGDDIREARRLFEEAGGTGQIVAKIERTEAVENIDSIIDSIIWVAVMTILWALRVLRISFFWIPVNPA